MVSCNTKYRCFRSCSAVLGDMVRHPCQQDQVNLVDHENRVVLLDLLHPKIDRSFSMDLNWTHPHTHFVSFFSGWPLESRERLISVIWRLLFLLVCLVHLDFPEINKQTSANHLDQDRSIDRFLPSSVNRRTSNAFYILNPIRNDRSLAMKCRENNKHPCKTCKCTWKQPSQYVPLNVSAAFPAYSRRDRRSSRKQRRGGTVFFLPENSQVNPSHLVHPCLLCLDHPYHPDVR